MSVASMDPVGWVVHRIVAQVESASPGQGYVVAAYVIAGVLLFGYGLSIYLRMRSTRDDIDALTDDPADDSF